MGTAVNSATTNSSGEYILSVQKDFSGKVIVEVEDLDVSSKVLEVDNDLYGDAMKDYEVSDDNKKVALDFDFDESDLTTESLGVENIDVALGSENARSVVPIFSTETLRIIDGNLDKNYILASDVDPQALAGI
jgi:hypothetical protein